MLLVKITIDFPEEILHRAKIVAAQRKSTFRDLVITGLTHTLDMPPQDEDAARRKRAARLIAALSKGRNADPIGLLNRDELHDRHELL
jgi:hypothetical protein